MKATIYTHPQTRTGVIATDVTITQISEAPRYTKRGVMFKRPFGSKVMTPDQVSLLNLWEQGIVRADVIYPDGTHDSGVWVNIKDINSK